MTWQLASSDTRCGGCGRLIKRGEPVLPIHLAGLQRRLKRCEDCRGPADLSAVASVQQEPREAPSFRPVAELAETFDARMAQAGRDE